MCLQMKLCLSIKICDWNTIKSLHKAIKSVFSIQTHHALTMMLGSVAYLGSFSLRSAVTTAGSLTLIDSRPPSISLVMASLGPSTVSFDTKVAWGQPSREATIWPVWLQSPSIAWRDYVIPYKGKNWRVLYLANESFERMWRILIWCLYYSTDLRLPLIWRFLIWRSTVNFAK